MTSQKTVETFLKKLKKLKKSACWGLIAGEGTGSVLSMHFGKKLRLKDPIDNPFLTTDEQNYWGEYRLFVKCPWRLDNKEEVLCGSDEPNYNDGEMIKKIKSLRGQKVMTIDIDTPGLDLKLTFSEGVTLSLFCLATDLEEVCENYNFYNDGMHYCVKARSEIELRPSKQAYTVE